METNAIATLQDYQASIERSFKKIEKNLSEYSTSEISQQNLMIANINRELANVKNNIAQMRLEISTLNEEENQTKWQGILSGIQSKNDSFKKQISDLTKEKRGDFADPTDINIKVDLSQITSQQAIERGGKIVKESGNAIRNMVKIVDSDVRTMQEVNKELDRQGQALDNADKDLKEIDFSLKRAGEQMKTMFKMFATDKLIMCMIVVIVLVIISIIVVSLVGGDENKNYNTPTDIFSNKKNIIE